MPGKLLYWQGFECGTNAYLDELGYARNAGWIITTDEARGGSFSIGLTLSNVLHRLTSPALGTGCANIGFHLKPTTSGGVLDQQSVSLDYAGSAVLRVGVDPLSGLVSIMDSGSNTLATSVFPVTLGIYHWFSVTADPVAGEIKVWVDGGVDPIVEYAGSVPSWNGYSLWARKPPSGDPVYFDNIVIADAAYGRIPEMYIAAAHPGSDYSVQLTPSTGTDNYALVNSVTAPASASITEYNETTVAPAKDVYGLGSVAFSAEDILGVNVMTMVARDGTISAGRCIVDDDGTEIQGSTDGIGGAGEFVPFRQFFVPDDTDPEVVWTPSDLTTMRVGFEFTNGA